MDVLGCAAQGHSFKSARLREGLGEEIADDHEEEAGEDSDDQGEEEVDVGVGGEGAVSEEEDERGNENEGSMSVRAARRRTGREGLGMKPLCDGAGEWSAKGAAENSVWNEGVAGKG